jgi:hypothetical protein
MPDASNKRGVPLSLCPLDRFPLGPERAEPMIRMVFDNLIFDGGPSGLPLGRASI